MITIHIVLLIAIIVASLVVGGVVTFVFFSRKTNLDQDQTTQDEGVPLFLHRRRMRNPDSLGGAPIRGFGNMGNRSDPTDRLAGDSSTHAPPPKKANNE